MPPTGCVGPERLVRALQVSFFFLLFFLILTTPTACVSHQHAIYSTHTAPTGEFFFLLLFFLILTTPTACVCHRHAIYFTHTAPTACVGPKRVVWALQVSFFFFLLFFFYSNYTHSLRMTPTCHTLDPYATHRLRRARTTRSGPTGEFFFFLLLFFFILTTPTAYGCHPRHRYAIYFTHTAPTGCVGPKRLAWGLRVRFFFSFVFFNSNN